MKTADIIAELEAILADTGPTDAFTTPELAEALGLGLDATRVRLKALKKAGRLEVVRVPRESLSGVMRMEAGYRVLPEREG